MQFFYKYSNLYWILMIGAVPNTQFVVAFQPQKSVSYRYVVAKREKLVKGIF